MNSKPINEAHQIASDALTTRGWTFNTERGEWISPDGTQRGQLTFGMDFSYGPETTMVANVKLRHPNPNGEPIQYTNLLEWKPEHQARLKPARFEQLDTHPTEDLTVRTVYQDGQFVRHTLFRSWRIGEYKTDRGLLKAIEKHAEGPSRFWSVDKVHEHLKERFATEQRYVVRDATDRDGQYWYVVDTETDEVAYYKGRYCTVRRPGFADLWARKLNEQVS